MSTAVLSGPIADSGAAFQLTEDQDKALKALVAFLSQETETVFVLEGYSGTGKSTLMRIFLQQLPKLMQSIRLINPKAANYELVLTATTNKAAQNLQQITNTNVTTLHSFLGLTVKTDYCTGKTSLTQRQNLNHHNKLVIVDEASYIDADLMRRLFGSLFNSKVIFVGDPAQLTPVKSKGSPVFLARFPSARLSQVVRQAQGNPIIELSTKFRETVTTGQWFHFTPDGEHVVYLPNRDDFEQAIKDEFLRSNWSYNDSKILAWRNATCITFNRRINDLKRGHSAFHVNDYAVVNSYYRQDKYTFKTDELVLITDISPPEVEYGVKGRYYTLNYMVTAFCPDSFQEARKRYAQAVKNKELQVAEQIDKNWVDLRSVYACTINKSQGSTYDKVFIDLDDLKGCRNNEQIARMLYVGVSRARHQVILTGDFI